VRPAERRDLARVAVIAADDRTRGALIAALEAAGHPVTAWAEAVEPLLVLGTRVDVCLCAEPSARTAAEQLRRRGAAVVVVHNGTGTVDAVRAVAGRRPAPDPFPARPARPRLSPRQREVLVAYAVGNDVLPTVARRLGMERETFKTHLRRIRDKYAAVGRPAPTRRDLYVRALEDGLIAPPADGGDAGRSPPGHSGP
jgi:DNA-binding CsgD family transcriptional regulator